jgi:drug/metabolite transporter (DMT)-like permease
MKHKEEKVGEVFAIFFAWLILLGNIFLLYDGTFALNPADLVLFFAPIMYVVANIISKKLLDIVHWSTILLFRYLFSAFVLLGIAHVYEVLSVPDPAIWPFLLVFAIFVFGFQKIFWQMALERMDVAKTTAIAMTYPALSIVWAYFILSEIPSGYQWVGIIFMAAGFYFILQTKSQQYAKVSAV